MDQELISRLVEGVFLEVRGVMIPWLTEFDQLRSLGDPEYREGEQRDDLLWKGEKVLGGSAGEFECSKVER